MRGNSNIRYLIGFLITFGLIILLIFLIFRGGGDTETKVPKTSRALSSYSSTDAVVRLTIDGPITADEMHRSVEVTVGKEQVDYRLIQGYNNNAIDTRTYTNNEAAYYAFLSALETAGYPQGEQSDKGPDGLCPLNKRYIMTLRQNDKDIFEYWATDCGGEKTFNGNLGLVLDLFRRQIPLEEGVSLDSAGLL